MSAYYNENDPYPAQWLRNLIKEKLIPDGDVDERSIRDVQPDDLKGYDQCHFFAGIGGWPYALRLAGWPDDRQVWTGSCPCQPFSVAGKRKGTSDERHLWPDWFNLIRERRPPIVFGEQVAGAIAVKWIDGVFNDLERILYTCGSAVLSSFAVSARHERKRFFWVADSQREGRARHKQVECVSGGPDEAFPILGDPLAGARSFLESDNFGLLPSDGVSVGVERCATQGYGNAIVPQVAAEFIGAYLDSRELAA